MPHLHRHDLEEIGWDRRQSGTTALGEFSGFFGNARCLHINFHIGESVMLRPAVSRNVPGGVYEVTKQLPHNGLEFEYRIKSANEPHERIAGESELIKP